MWAQWCCDQRGAGLDRLASTVPQSTENNCDMFLMAVTALNCAKLVYCIHCLSKRSPFTFTPWPELVFQGIFLYI